MTPRQALALARPLDRAGDLTAIEELRTVQHVGGGELLVVILAVDR